MDIRSLNHPRLDNAKKKCENDNTIHKSHYIHTCLQHIYRNMMNEDYTILLGVDSFLFLDNLTIQEYFIKYNITDDISQIFFRWISIINTSNPKYNLFENIDLNLKYYDVYFFTLGNRKLVIEPRVHSHHFELINDNSKTFFDNKIYTINKNTRHLEIIKIINNQLDIKGTTDNCIYHFVSRNIYDVFVKTYYYWSSSNFSKKKLKILCNDLIINYKFPQTNSYYIRINILQKKCDKNIKIPNILINIQNNNYIFNYKEFNVMLNECNITQPQFLSFVNKYLHDYASFTIHEFKTPPTW